MVATAYVALEARQMRRDRADLLNDLARARAEGDRWRAAARAHVDGLSRAIRDQFDAWRLTEGEADIAVLMLKGLSHKKSRACATPERRPSDSKPARSTASQAFQVGPSWRRSFSRRFFWRQRRSAEVMRLPRWRWWAPKTRRRETGPRLHRTWGPESAERRSIYLPRRMVSGPESNQRHADFRECG